MRKSIEINGVMYKPAEMTFNNICRMEELGAPITEGDKYSMNLIRGYTALCMGVDPDTAGKTIESHVINGGEVSVIAETFREAVDESDFFRQINQMATEETPSVEKKSRAQKQ